MSKNHSNSALIAALLVTLGLLGGGVWFLSRLSPNLLFPNGPSTSLSTRDVNRRGSQRLSILGDTFSGYSTFRHGPFQDALAENGIDVGYADEFDQSLRAQQLSEGNADLIVTTLDQFLQHQPQGKIVGLIDRTIGADAVVLNTQQYPQLKSLLDLQTLVSEARSQGQSVGMAFAGDTPSEFLALVLDTKFDSFNLSDFAVTRVADASDAWQLMQDPNQNMAIAVIWEPFVTQARQQGYTVVLSSQDAPKSIVDVIVASDRLLQSNPDVVSDLLESYYRRIDANVGDASQLQTQIAEDGNLPPADAAAVMNGIEFFTAAEAHRWITDGTLDQRIKATAAVLALSGRIDQVPSQTDTLVMGEAIAKAADNTQTLISLVRADNPELADRLEGKQRSINAIVPTLQTSQVQSAPDIGNLQVRGEVKFATGLAQLSQSSQQTLSQLGQEISEFNAQTVGVRVIGHTSKTGSAAVNQTLSQERAQVVVDYLRNQGIPHNIVAEGKGFNEPLVGVTPADPSNQRTEIRMVRVNTPTP